ncbi:NHL repeat-containing protein [Teichococcus vastitatis]|uniref:Peptidase n=1 Tax=Teichococcus vastitatis TaxID=2307076 RepID=A0ABS9W8V1_9PROT|nr:peptidase [Pseudoroseomonas vastitatis]MCI0755718.1 peptidase [Pseudoroseomonas vastitatis]
MARQDLFVRLDATLYRVERPWGRLPDGAGRVTDVSADAEGRVYVLLRSDPYVDAATPAVAVLSSEGALLAAWGAGAVADGHMLTVSPDGRVFVVDRDAHEIIIFDREGTRLGGLGTRHGPGEPFNAPSDVAFGPDGTIYVADGYAATRIHRFSPEGVPLGGWGEPGAMDGQFTTPHAIWVLPDGTVAVTDRENDRLQLFTAEGHFLRAFGSIPRVMNVVGDAEGRLYVTDQIPRLSMYEATGKLLGRCRPVLNGAHGMWRSPTGMFYLAEGNPSRVTRLVPVEAAKA